MSQLCRELLVQMWQLLAHRSGHLNLVQQGPSDGPKLSGTGSETTGSYGK